MQHFFLPKIFLAHHYASKKNIVFMMYYLLYSGLTYAQNLVPNGSFENIKVTPQELNTKVRPSQVLEGWREIAMGEIGYVHPKSNVFNPKKSMYGSQTAQDGESYAWFRAAGFQFGSFGDTKRYYFQTKLTTPLTKGMKYKLSFYVSLADNSSVAIENIAAYFFEKPIIKQGDSPNPLYSQEQSTGSNALDLLEMKALTKVKNANGIIKDTENWTLIEEEFVAKGGEIFLVIGNFEMQGKMNYENMPKKKEHWNWRDSYYFLDNVVLNSTGETVEPIANEVVTDLALLTTGKTVVMENILFETEKHDLLPQSQKTLDSLVTILVSNPTINIQVEGHTDSIGDSLANIKLSFLRAESVKNYLTSNKITPSRIKTIGFGASIPLLPNTTQRGRRRNRRVSIKKT